jgi:hypothetical protein
MTIITKINCSIDETQIPPNVVIFCRGPRGAQPGNRCRGIEQQIAEAANGGQKGKPSNRIEVCPIPGQ